MSSTGRAPGHLKPVSKPLGDAGDAGDAEAVEPVESVEPAEAAAAVAVRRGELAAGARSSTLGLRYALTTRSPPYGWPLGRRTHHGRLRAHTGVF
jgi:hypothetical protein